MLSSIRQYAATHGAHYYGPGTYLYSWVERGKIGALPKDAILKCGQCWFRTHDPWVVSLTQDHYATEATTSATFKDIFGAVYVVKFSPQKSMLGLTASTEA